jgi:hypothetical protein
MPDANAIAEKLKDLGLRHGEKAAVAIASLVFFLCATFAARMETINTTPEKIKQVTKVSESNLTRPETREKILERLEAQKIKDSNFAKVVDEQVKTALVADDYKSARDWVTPEPGAGLIRDTPVLITVADLYAYPGRGGLLVFQLDKEGNRVPDLDKDKAKPEERRRRRRRRPAMGGMMGGMGMMGGIGGQRKRQGKSKADLEREAALEQGRKKRALEGKLVGSGDALAEQKAEEDAADKGPPPKEITKGFRWVAITGVLDHAKLVANYRAALKNPAIAHPNYKRLDLQRKTLRPDGTWTDWENVDSRANEKILDNLPEEDEELAPETVRPEALVDPLPFMKAGLWEKVHIASLVPKEKKEVPKEQVVPGGGMMGNFSRPGGMGMRGNMIPGGGGMGGGMGPGAGSMSRMGMGMMGGRGGMMAGGMMGGGLMGAPTETPGNYWKSDASKVMIRALDFTVEEDTTYRYRVRIVVHNPNYNHEDVAFGVNTKATELHGDWSPATDEVQMPADVSPYALATEPASPGSDVKVTFQVIRFHPDNGVTAPRTFQAGPGEVIGEPKTTEIPVADGSGKKTRTIDFNSRQIVLDVNVIKKTGGSQPLPTGMIGAPVERAALALLLRPDASVVVHNAADDLANDVRMDIFTNYNYEIAQSNKERKKGTGIGMMGRMGGMGSMSMMGGMGGMR